MSGRHDADLSPYGLHFAKDISVSQLTSPCRRCLGSLLLIAILSLAATPAYSADVTKLTTVEGITEYQLENGMQVLIFPDPSKPTVTVNLTIFCGSRHEGYGESGMAHLLEHMLFKGTPLHANIPKLLSERGARFNGTTSYDRTNYYETLPASEENLEFAIRLESDRMINSFIKGEDLASEMTVVRNEFESGENSPSRVLRQRMMATAYEWHNYGKAVIGNRSDIERVPLPRLRDFYRKHYQPDNAMLVIAGQFDVDKALALANKYFGAIPKPERELDRTYTEEPPQDGERIVSLRRVGEVGLVGVAYHIPAASHPDFAPVDVLGYILAIEPAGRLYKSTVQTEMATSIMGGSYSLHDPSLLMMVCEVKDLENVPLVRKTMIQEIEKIGTDGVSQEEVDRVILQVTKQREQLMANSGRVALQLSEWASQGDWRLFFLYRDRMEKVTADDVKRVAAQYCRDSNRTVGLFVPTETVSRAVIPAAVNIAEMVEGYEGRETVAAGEVFDATPENIQGRLIQFKLDDGLEVGLLPKKTRGEVVRLSLTLRYGSLQNLEGLDTAGSMLGTLMTRGTASLDYQQLQDELDGLGASLSGSGGLGSVSFGIQTKRPQLQKTLDLLRQVLREPTLPSKELDVLKNEQLAGLGASQNEPQFLAMNRLRQLMFPYGEDDLRRYKSVGEQIESMQKLSLDDVQQLYSNYVGSNNGELVMVGDFDVDEVRAQLGQIFAGWKSEQDYKRIPRQSFIKDGQRVSVNTPDKKNAVYYAAVIVPIGLHHEDYPAVIIGNYILGGGSLSSRLGDRVRQKDGLSYGIGSGYGAYALEDLSRITIGAISNPENSPKVVAAIDEEIARLLKDGITDKELTSATTGYLESLKVQMNNDGTLSGMISSSIYESRPISYYDELQQRIERLTKEDVVEALRKHLLTKRLNVVTAGDFGSE
jgi:zinc protease